MEEMVLYQSLQRFILYHSLIVESINQNPQPTLK